MAAHLSLDDIFAWLGYHGLDSKHVIKVELDRDTVAEGCMRVFSYAHDGDRRLVGSNGDLLTEQTIVKLKAMPGQETLFQ